MWPKAVEEHFSLGHHVEEPIGHRFSNFSVSAVPCPGISWKCRFWFIGLDVGPGVFVFVTSSQETLIVLVRENHTFTARLLASLSEQRLENVTCQAWCGIWLRRQLACQRDLASNSCSVVQCVTEPRWASRPSPAEGKAWAFLEIEWDNITCNVLSQAQRK